MALETRVPDFRVILEIACVSSPEELLAIKRAYRFRYKHSLEEDVASHTNGDIRIRKLLVAIISTYKYDGEEFDEETAHSEANVLRDEITGKVHNHDELIRILTTRSKSQLKATFNKYKDIHGTSITKDMSGSPTDDLYFYALRTAIRCIKDPKKYFAKILRNAIKMEDTDEDALSRVIVNRAEKDLKEINELFVKRNNMSLEEAVSQHTSGDYKTFLLTLLGYEGI